MRRNKNTVHLVDSRSRLTSIETERSAVCTSLWCCLKLPHVETSRIWPFPGRQMSGIFNIRFFFHCKHNFDPNFTPIHTKGNRGFCPVQKRVKLSCCVLKFFDIYLVTATKWLKWKVKIHPWNCLNNILIMPFPKAYFPTKKSRGMPKDPIAGAAHSAFHQRVDALSILVYPVFWRAKGGNPSSAVRKPSTQQNSTWSLLNKCLIVRR